MATGQCSSCGYRAVAVAAGQCSSCGYRAKAKLLELGQWQ